MNLGHILPYRWRTRRDAARHAESIAGILQTRPIVPKRDGVVIFSMIGTAVLLPYLVAVKSLWQQIGRGRIALLDDGTLTAQDRAILAHHCGDPEIIRIDAVRTDDFPKGGTWERFLSILDGRTKEYWIQLDSDTVTLGPVPEVTDAIARNRSFMLLGDEDAQIGALPLRDFTARFYPEGPREGHIQHRIESMLDTVPGDRGWRYVRGCSGFAGFGVLGHGRPLAAAFFSEIERIVGREGAEIWGTEQVASNFQLANDAQIVLLPYARYLNYWGKDLPENVAFVHFVGTHRYANDAYARASVMAIEHLQAG